MAIEKKEFLTEWESGDLLKVLKDSAFLLKQTGEFSALRRDLKAKLVHQSEEIDFWIRRKKDVLRVDEGMLRALERIALERESSLEQEIEIAFGLYITHYNRKGTGRNRSS